MSFGVTIKSILHRHTSKYTRYNSVLEAMALILKDVAI